MKSIVKSTFSTRTCAIVCTAAAAAALLAGCGDADQDGSSPVTTTLTETISATPTVTSPPPGTATDTDAPITQPMTESMCDVTSEIIDAAIAQIAPPMPGVGWVEGDSNVNTCASLTYVTLDTEGATASSPYQLLLFHGNEFLGTGTACNLSYQTVAATADDRIDVRYRYIVGDEANADPQGEVYVSYQWNGSGVDMLGDLPEAVTRGQC